MNAFELVVIVIACLLVLFVIFMRGRGGTSPAGGYICPSCGTRGSPARSAKGSLLIEIVLWLCFIIPGLIYSLWRLSNRTKSCPACGASMIPVDTPRGRQMTRDTANRT